MNIKMFDILVSCIKRKTIIVFKAIYNYPTLKRFIFRMHGHAFNSFIFTLLSENRKRSLIFSHGEAEITELREAQLLDSLILINVVPGISVMVRVWAIFNKRGA